MKIYRLVIFLMLSILLCCNSCKCKKSVTPPNPVDQLPPATDTGANTIGCLVNGQALLPAGLSLAGGNKHATYQFSFDNAWHLNIYIGNQNSVGAVQSVYLFIDSLKTIQSQTYDLQSRQNGNASASYYYGSNSVGQKFYTTSSTNNWTTGKLTITKFDTVKQIVSGTFWFNALDQYGDSVKVTDGRFDMIFSY